MAKGKIVRVLVSVSMLIAWMLLIHPAFAEETEARPRWNCDGHQGGCPGCERCSFCCF